MEIILPLFIIILFAFSLTFLFNNTPEESIFIVLFSIIPFLYIFYIFNILNLGFYILYFIYFAFILYSLYKIIKNKSNLKLTKYFTPGVLFFIISLFAIYVLTKNSSVKLWDELRLWGAYPKLLFYDGRVLLNDGSKLLNIMRSYLPGLPLFQYFFLKSSSISGVFHENIIFFSYAILSITVFLPLMKNITWKNFYLCIPISIISILCPLTFFNSGFDYSHYYKTLFVDPIIGILFGYGMYIVYENVYEHNINLIKFILILVSILLFKDSGMMFSVVLVIASIIRLKLFTKNNKENIRKYIYKLLCVFGAVLFFTFSWKLVLSIYNVNYNLSQPMTLNNIISLIFSPTDQQKFLLKYFFQHLHYVSLVNTNLEFITKYITYQNLFIISFIIFVVVYFFIERDNRKSFISSCIFLYIANFIFVFGLILLYCLSLNNIESYCRYINTICLAFFTFLSTMLIKICLKKGVIKGGIMLTLAVVLICVVFPVKSFSYELIDMTYMESINIVEDYSKISKEDITKVYVISNNDISVQSLYVHQLYYHFIDYNIFVSNFEDNIKNIGEFASFEDYMHYLYDDNIEYLICLNLNDDLLIDSINTLGGKFKNVNNIYKIKKIENNIILENID